MKNTIMIVDDVTLNIDILAESLGDKYIIMPATSGRNAMKLLERRKPDLVLLDVFMPGIDGFEVLKFMKMNDELARIPVIFVTGEHDTDIEEKGLALGAVDYVKKPYNTAIISVKVQNHLELKAYRDNLEDLVKKHTEKLEERAKELVASREAIIMGMSLMSERHDKVTGDHIQRIKNFTDALAKKVRELYPDLISEIEVNKIALFSPMHDIGKICISDMILKKTGLLTEEENHIMQMHTVEGANILRETKLVLSESEDGTDLDIAIEIAQSHHEKYDGTGYPYGLKGDEIPISARIVSIADVYDALRSIRTYKEPFTHKMATDIILIGDRRTNPKHFDPRVLKAFELINEEFDEIFEQLTHRKGM